MSSQSSREKILGKIKTALEANALPIPFPEAEKANDFFAKDDNITIEEKFASEFTKLGGKYIYCENEAEMFSQLLALKDTLKWNQFHIRDSFLIQLCKEHDFESILVGEDMSTIEVGISLTDCLVARTGSVVMTSAPEHGRALPVYAPIHIVIAFANQLVWDISDAIQLITHKYHGELPSMVSLTTGPSRTADIEKTLVVGVHGPKEVFVFYIDKNWKAT